MSRHFAVGQLVSFPEAPGIGRVGAVVGGTLRVDFFESVAEPEIESRTVPGDLCRRVHLSPQTRVFRHNPSTGEWLAGRVKGDDSSGYFIRFPNQEYDLPVPESQLRVRWDRPVRDSLEVLVSGGNESGFLYNARIPMLHNLVTQRAVCASTPSLLAAATEIYPHQLRAALTVLSDPVQRYLLADEVGLGKTIQAGYVILQTLIDNPGASVLVVAPDQLRRQWMAELRTKFFTDDFPAQVTITSHEAPERWSRYHGRDLVVVDEAHLLAQDRDNADPTYQALACLAHSASKLLLLSATPVTSSPATHLGLLHLLDPHLYKWSDREAFERRYQHRAELATSLYGLNAEFHQLLPPTIDMIRGLLPPEDTRFGKLAARVLDLVDADGELRDQTDVQELATRVASLRAHLSETYRLHRRVIRHRRSTVLREDDEALSQYEVRGRTTPTRLEAETYDPVSESLSSWQTQTWGHLLDQGLEAGREGYGLALGVLVSRVGGISGDYLDALRWRVRRDEEAALRAGLSPRERRHLTAPAVIATFEAQALADLESDLAATNSTNEINELVDTLLPALRRGGRIIVFCGPGTLASLLTARLRERFRKVSFFEHTCAVGSEQSERAVRDWRGQPGTAVLITDDTAEDGLNLQVTNTVIHVRLPWSPNQLEQRLGRADRYVESPQQSQPPNQYVYTRSDSLSEAWLSLLTDGYHIFTDSVSTLQDAIAQGLADIWGAALEDGPDGLVDSADTVQSQLKAARAEIDQMDMLESIFDSSPEEDEFVRRLSDFEVAWQQTRDVTLDYAGRDDFSGVRLRHRETGAHGDAFDLTPRTLISPHLYERGSLTSDMKQGTFKRNEALKNPGTRIFRLGSPLVDTLANVVWRDDRGQATAFWRADLTHRGEPEPYFGFDYLVEADVDTAVALALEIPQVRNHQQVRTALRRRADQLLSPLTLKVWVPAGGSAALSDGPLRDWLNAPYRETDHNYNAKRIHDLLSVFDGRRGYEAAARAAEAVARAELERVTNLPERCAQAQRRGWERLAVEKAQAEARQAAGRLLGDAESSVLSMGVNEALVCGLTNPTIRLVAATCVLRTGLRRIHGAN